MLLLALLLFPIGEKVSHDFEHFNDDNCEIKGSHFCAAEHDCSICHYLFSSSSIPPKSSQEPKIFAKQISETASSIVFYRSNCEKFVICLRGPPAC
jgi:hypothetical protein